VSRGVAAARPITTVTGRRDAGMSRTLGVHRCGSAGLASIKSITAASVKNPAPITSSCQFATGLRVFAEVALAGWSRGTSAVLPEGRHARAGSRHGAADD
jgi:hypothetical protein